MLDAQADLKAQPVTAEETLFVTFLILHLDAVFQAGRQKMFRPAATLPEDIRQFFSLPVPRAVWEKLRPLQEPEFVRFVESSLK